MRKLLALFAAGAMVITLVGPVAAAEWSFFGDVKMRSFWADDSKETGNFIGGGTDRGGAIGQFDDTDLHWGKSVGAAFGATVEAGDISGHVSLRPLENSIHVRGGDFFQMFGTWNFGAGELLVGKTFGPVNWFGSNMVFLDENCCLGFGGILSYVKPMIQLSFEGDWGTFKVAALEPETAVEVWPTYGIPHFQQSVSSGPGTTAGGPYQTTITATAAGVVAVAPGWAVEEDTNLPKLEASYSNTWGPLNVTVLGGWQEWEAVIMPTATTEQEIDVESWVLGLGLKLALGAFYVNGDIFRGQNLGQYQFTFQLGSDDAVYDPNTRTLLDNDTLGWLLAAGFTVNPMITLEAGVGWNEHELDRTPGNWEDETIGYYLQAVITLAPGVTITPEIGKLDYKDHTMGDGRTTVDDGDTVWYVAQWRITF
jgi:hypothetical protein